MIKCICINAKNKPPQVPFKKWVVEGNQYHVIAMIWDKRKILGVHLSEIDLDETCAPYDLFRISRFVFNDADLDKLKALGEDCADINWDEDSHLLKEIELETIEN